MCVYACACGCGGGVVGGMGRLGGRGACWSWQVEIYLHLAHRLYKVCK